MSTPNDAITAPTEAPAAPDKAGEIRPADEAEVLSIFDQLETDTSAEEDGRWFNNLFPGADVKIRRFTARASLLARQRLLTKYRRFARNNEFSTELNLRILNEQLAEAVILDWRGAAFREKDGSSISFSKEAALLLLSRLPNFRITVGMVASDLDNFRVETREDIAGN